VTRSSGQVYSGRTLAPGTATGRALVLDEPLSLWGGFDLATGRVVDRHHPQQGSTLTARMVLMPAGRGSSSSSSILAEAVRLGTAPAGIILLHADEILLVGALVAAELYGCFIPIVVLDQSANAAIHEDDIIGIEAHDDHARITVSRPEG
jgi:predicted aconitase with swiveling domain